jgi:hypothetical protein
MPFRQANVPRAYAVRRAGVNARGRSGVPVRLLRCANVATRLPGRGLFTQSLHALVGHGLDPGAADAVARTELMLAAPRGA